MEMADSDTSARWQKADGDDLGLDPDDADLPGVSEPPAPQNWPECLAYNCRSCKEHTINRIENPCTDALECPDCFSVPQLDQPQRR